MKSDVEEATQLLVELIQNKCINPPGNELKSIRTIEKYLKDRNISCQVYESAPERGNLIAEIKGLGKKPSLMLGPSHVDVVPIRRYDFILDETNKGRESFSECLTFTYDK